MMGKFLLLEQEHLISIINDASNFQPTDLSAERNTNNDFPLSEELEEFIDGQRATLPNTLGPNI